MVLVLTGASAALGAEVRFTEQGLVPDGGASGSFCLKYPGLLDAAEKVTAPTV